MASSYKIPKKKGSDSAPLHTSPLSRLQSSAPEFKSYGHQSGRGDRMHAGSALGSSAGRQSAPLFRDVVQSLLGLHVPDRGAATANHSRGWSSQSQPGQRAESSSSCFSNGWRPKRASDRLLQPAVPSPPQKKRSDLRAQSVSVEAPDSLAELRSDGHAGSLSSPAWRRGDGHAGSLSSPAWRRGDAAKPKGDAGENSPPSGSETTSEDDFVSPPRTRNTPRAPPGGGRSLYGRRGLGGRRSLDRTAWLAAGRNVKKTTPTEPIVLSSEEEEEEEEDEGDRGKRTTQSSEQRPTQAAGSSEGESEDNNPPPSFLQLDFTSLHAGLTHAHANGTIMITENGITIPLKGSEEGDVTVVASEVRGYGVWDGGVAQGGTLLADWEGPAPSLLFLSVTDPQANLLQRELSAIQTSTSPPGPPCCFLLLLLKEQLTELQAALLASFLDMEEYRKSSSSEGPASPLDWTDGLLLLHTCPPPLDQHLLRLLGHSAVRSSQRTKKSPLNTAGLQQLPSRLIQYPAAPSKGRITVTTEDLACLGGGKFLNDVIIDFYLKYLVLEGVGGPVADRSHIFSSFFYKQLSRRRAAGEDSASSVPDRDMRHQRVKTWTRNVDIFTKDFLFVPVNQEAHWFLVLICFPGLEEVQYQEFQRPTGGSERAAGNPSAFSLRSQQPPCTQQGCQRDSVLKRPCILVMDSLKLSYHENVCRLLRDYLQVEWAVRRGTPRHFTSESMKSCSCRVPQQDNSSDCGLYLLQYTHSFLQNPVVHFDLPLRLENWFPRQLVRQKREEIRALILRMRRSQNQKLKP
ncbi:sentrin-specific protease 7-like isoform X2 [Sander lucioperca]|uniref:sentrin-specific protease 7-like isoform X2 n=1 Tax=Sander lucioperca TaxID=283035 RepID=UPI00165377B0|nr:sentrin-specific protease 7-like isoform X2 [Sander lucioperca]